MEGGGCLYLSLDYKKKIVEFLVEKINPEFIYLFGSFARGEAREDSDIDLAVYVGEDIGEYELFVLGNELSFDLGRDVQIIDLKSASTVFAAQIVGNREVLYCRDDFMRANYEIRIFKDYAKLNEERKVVLDAIERNGKVYE